MPSKLGWTDILPGAEFVAVVTIQLTVTCGDHAAHGRLRLIERWKAGDVPTKVFVGSDTGNGSRDRGEERGESQHNGGFHVGGLFGLKRVSNCWLAPNEVLKSASVGGGERVVGKNVSQEGTNSSESLLNGSNGGRSEDFPVFTSTYCHCTVLIH